MAEPHTPLGWLTEFIRIPHPSQLGALAVFTGEDTPWGNPDPWANFREAVFFGTTPFAGAMIRLGDKHIRTVNLRRNPDNERVGEAITETIRDAVAYPLIAYCLLEEQEVAA